MDMQMKGNNVIRNGKKYPRSIGLSFICIAQGLLAGLVVLCVLAVMRWTEGTLSLSDTGREFVNTELFLQTVEGIIHEKVSCVQNMDLFEDNGTYAPEKLVDIRQYASGSLEQSSQNPGTSYTIADLISFGMDGADQMQARLDKLLGQMSEQEAGNVLLQDAGELETILPSSGILLADYAKVSANASLAIVEYYRNLSETAIDVAQRYMSYRLEAEEGSNEAPSNVYYYVENTSTRRKYTNLEANTLAQAERIVSKNDDLTSVFAGERRFNIMVVDADLVMSDKASSWFTAGSIVGNNEKLLIAVDLSFPVGDSLQSTAADYNAMLPWMNAGFAAGIISTVLLIILLVLSIIRSEKLGAFDHIPTELAFGISMVATIIAVYAGRRLNRAIDVRGIIPYGIETAVLYWMELYFLLSFVRRTKRRTLWKNSVAYTVIMGSRQVISARQSRQRLLIAYVGFIILNLGCLVVGGAAGVIMFIVLNLAALLYLMRDAVGGQNVREGLRQIQAGRLDYRIPEDVLTGESREMARAVNEMGEGLSQSVEAMLRSERMRAELITNVSHDLKTPLTSIINYVDLLRREEPGSEKSREYLDILDKKAWRLKHLTEDLIEVSKISSGNIELHPMELDLRSFVMQAVGEFEERFEENSLDIVMALPKEKMMIEADGSQLWRVFENVLSNIAKYAKKGTEVRILSAAEGEMVWVTLENVPAIPITVSADELLERFSRGDASRISEGSGLGLSIAKSLTELMGGTFILEVAENRFQIRIGMSLSQSGSKQSV